MRALNKIWMRKKQRYYFRESKPKVEANRSSIDCTAGNSSFEVAPFLLEDLTWHAVDLNKHKTDSKTMSYSVYPRKCIFSPLRNLHKLVRWFQIVERDQYLSFVSCYKATTLFSLSTIFTSKKLLLLNQVNFFSHTTSSFLFFLKIQLFNGNFVIG